MKELRRSSPIILQKSVLTCRKSELVFFPVWVLGEGESISLYLVYHFRPLHRHLDTAAESSLLRIAGSRTRTRSLWFPNVCR